METVDIYPTLLELCHLKPKHKVDGESYKEVLDGTPSTVSPTAYSYYRNGISLRTERYRLTKYYRSESPMIELYDLLKDPYETVNIAADRPNLVAELMPKLEKGNKGLYTSK